MLKLNYMLWSLNPKQQQQQKQNLRITLVDTWKL